MVDDREDEGGEGRNVQRVKRKNTAKATKNAGLLVVKGLAHPARIWSEVIAASLAVI
jgi:hypothetical protein